MVAREFRGRSVSTEETFSSTTPLMMVKVLMVISLVKGLLMSTLDVSDVFFFKSCNVKMLLYQYPTG